MTIRRAQPDKCSRSIPNHSRLHCTREAESDIQIWEIKPWTRKQANSFFWEHSQGQNYRRVPASRDERLTSFSALSAMKAEPTKKRWASCSSQFWAAMQRLRPTAFLIVRQLLEEAPFIIESYTSWMRESCRPKDLQLNKFKGKTTKFGLKMGTRTLDSMKKITIVSGILIYYVVLAVLF